MITITTVTNSYKLNDQRYQKGDLSVSYQDDGTVIIGNYHANVSDITVDGQTFDTTALFDAYIADKLFKSGGGATGVGVASVTGNIVSGTASNVVVSLPIGTDRQLLGFEDGALTPETLGWRHFSDLPNPPTFNTGVLSGTTFNPDGTAMFYFHELNDAVGASAKALTIPVYTTLGRLKVGNAVNADEAMSLGQLNTMASDVVSGSTIAKREQDGTIAVAYAGEEYSAVPLRQMLEFAGTTVVRPTVGSTTVIPIGAKGKYIVVYSGTGGVANIDLGIANLLNNEGLEIVVINKSDDGGVVLRSFSGQTQILPDAGGVLVASTTIGAGSTQNFICDGINVIGI